MNSQDRLDLAPAPPHQPIQWRRAWRLVRELVADPEQTEKVFELFDAIGGNMERHFQRFAADSEGRRLLRERTSLVAAMADRAALAALPAGSLGRAYLAFAMARDFAADGLIQANERSSTRDGADDEHRCYYGDRLTSMHDLWHVLTDYGTDEVGESALAAFSLAQNPSRTFAVIVLVALVLVPRTWTLRYERFLLRAWLRGRRAAQLDCTPWEELLARPLSEVRYRLAIEPSARAHPKGILAATRREAQPSFAA